MKDVIVIGGGIAGIAAARAHIDKGAKVHLIERSSRLGGVLESTDVDGVPRNHSAQTIALTQDLAQRFKHWGVFALLKPAPDLANTRCIVFNGKVHRISNPLHVLTSGLLPISSPFKALARMHRPFPDGDPTVADVARHYADDKVVGRLARPIISGIYAGDPERLSFSSCFPSFAARLRDGVKQPREERHVYTPVNGMSTLIDELAKPIKQVHLNTAVDSISRQKDVWLVDTGTERFEARTLVLATGAEATAGLIRGLNSGLADELSAIPHSGVQVLHCSYDRSQGSPLNAFGALWADHGPVRGVMDQSVILGLEGSTQYMAVYSEPDAIEQEILNEVRKVLSLTGRINIDHQVLWNRAIPQYVVGHQKIIDDVDILEHQHPGLHLIGSFRGGVSIADRVRQGAGTA